MQVIVNDLTFYVDNNLKKKKITEIIFEDGKVLQDM